MTMVIKVFYINSKKFHCYNSNFSIEKGFEKQLPDTRRVFMLQFESFPNRHFSAFEVERCLKIFTKHLKFI